MEKELIEFRLDKLEGDLTDIRTENKADHAEMQKTLTQIQVDLGKQKTITGWVSGFVSLMVSVVMGNFFKRG